MQISRQSRTTVLIAAVLTAVLCRQAPGQDAPTKDAQSREAKGIPPRATPADYQAHAQAGTVTVAAEFTGHSVATPQATFSTADYVVVEVGLFGPPEARIKLSNDDFSLRINGKKTPLPAQPYAITFRSLKDPEWEPPASADKKSKTSLDTGGKSQGDALPAIVHMPIELERAMQQRVQKAALPEGERAVPVAGLIFFQHGGGKIQSIELVYSGPAGDATMALHP